MTHREASRCHIIRQYLFFYLTHEEEQGIKIASSFFAF